MSKNVLLTGGAGFIGHLVIKEILVNTDWNLTVIDRLSYAGNLERINEVVEEAGVKSKNRLKFFYHDLKAEPHEGIIERLSETNIILHIGASSHVTRSVKNPHIFIQDNIIGTFNLLELSRNLDNLELFYYFSTDEVFGPSEKDVKFLEWDRYNSKNPYSATKAAAEELTIAYANTYSIPSLITHCSNVYGERQNSEKFIPNTIKKILNDEEVLIHTDSKNNPGSRYYIFNQDLAKSILFLTKNYEKVKNKAYELQKKHPTKVNITGASLIDNLDVAKLISKRLGKEFNYQLQNKDPDRPGHDIKYGLDNTLLESLGGVYDRDFEKGINDTVDWYLDNKSWL
jgi:dTDP-glucose 4,6-dehydratase|tara:strand:+ start:28 stop:1053 length:1026 start_codon:yes stop_codon:yes gene_type:complete